MPFKILADENVNLNIVKFLRNQKIKVISIFEGYKSMPDVKILKLSTKLNALLLTEDSDFGEWIFAHKKENIGVIFLRYESNEINDIINSLKIVFRLSI